MKRYFNLLIEFRGCNQCLKMPRDYGNLQLGPQPYQVYREEPAGKSK